MVATTPTRRRWFRFSLRTLFVTVTAFAVLAAWIAYHLNWIRERRNAPVFEGESTGVLRTPTRTQFVKFAIDAPWPLGWFGEEGKTDLMVSSSLPEREVERIGKLFPEAELELLSPDEESEILSEMKQP